MDTKRILEKAKATPADHASVRRAARYVVRDLRTRDIDTLATSRRHVAQAADAAEAGSFSSVYLTALGDVLAAFEAQLSDELERAADARAALHPGAPALLRALDRGISLPSDLAREVGKEKYQVTRLLERLREDGLVEVRSAQRDKRKRPHYLTARGDAVLDSLPAPEAGKDPKDVLRDVLLFEFTQLEGQEAPAFARTFADRVITECVVPHVSGQNLMLNMHAASVVMDQSRADSSVVAHSLAAVAAAAMPGAHNVVAPVLAAAKNLSEGGALPTMTPGQALPPGPQPSALPGAPLIKELASGSHTTDTDDE